MYIEECKSLIDYALQSGSKDPSLAHAAIILTVFEFQPHFLHSSKRAEEALLLLDKVGMACWDTQIDKDFFEKAGAPFQDHSNKHPHYGQSKLDDEESIAFHVRNWALLPPWTTSTSVGEIRKEEMRRMVWIGVSMAAALSVWKSTVRQRLVETQMSRPASVSGLAYVLLMQIALLFPGNIGYTEVGDLDGDNAPWVLYHRASASW